MCLAVPAKLLECDGSEATADLCGNRLRISTALVPEARKGDWVLLHAGFAIERLDLDAAQRHWDALSEMAEAATPSDAAAADRDCGGQPSSENSS